MQGEAMGTPCNTKVAQLVAGVHPVAGMKHGYSAAIIHSSLHRRMEQQRETTR